MRKPRGFTLIELIIVIVILGLLAAVAIPKYVDMRGEAAVAQANGVFAAAQAAAATNFSANMVGQAGHPLIVDGATLLGAMDSPPNDWSASGAAITTTGFTITVDPAESTTAKAVLTKSW